jgi:hypothetical protein
MYIIFLVRPICLGFCMNWNATWSSSYIYHSSFYRILLMSFSQETWCFCFACVMQRYRWIGTHTPANASVVLFALIRDGDRFKILMCASLNEFVFCLLAPQSSVSQCWLHRTCLSAVKCYISAAYVTLPLRLILQYPDTEFQARFTYLCDSMQSSFHL